MYTSYENMYHGVLVHIVWKYVLGTSTCTHVRKYVPGTSTCTPCVKICTMVYWYTSWENMYWVPVHVHLVWKYVPWCTGTHVRKYVPGTSRCTAREKICTVVYRYTCEKICTGYQYMYTAWENMYRVPVHVPVHLWENVRSQVHPKRKAAAALGNEGSRGGNLSPSQLILRILLGQMTFSDLDGSTCT
jgi:hypothetical protein